MVKTSHGSLSDLPPDAAGMPVEFVDPFSRQNRAVTADPALAEAVERAASGEPAPAPAPAVPSLADEILDGVAPVPFLGDLHAWLQNSAALSQPWLSAGIDPLRRFYSFPTDPGGRRPSLAFFACLLGYGAEGAARLLDGFLGGRAGLLADEPRKAVEAAVHAISLASGAGVVSWNLNGWKPYSERDSVLVVPLERALHARLKSSAANAGTTMAAIARASLEEAVSRLEAVQQAD